MKRSHDHDQVELAGALTSLRTETPRMDELSISTDKEDRLTGPPIDKRHVNWAAWAKYLEDYCHTNNVRIGIEFTDSIQKRNEEICNSKRAKEGRFVRLLPEALEAYRRSYVCHLGRKGRTRDIKFRRTACPFKMVAKSVYIGDNWEVEVTCPHTEHMHAETTGESAAPTSVEARKPPLQAPAFPVHGLKSNPPSRKVLTDMSSRCKRMPEIEQLCRRLLRRLELLHDSVAPLDEKDSQKLKYIDVVIRFVSLLQRKPLLSRLASNEAMAYKIRELQLKLDDVARGVGLNDETEMTEWSKQWETDRAEQCDKLTKMVSNASDRMMITEYRDRKLHGALVALNSGMKWKNQPSQMLELKKKTLDRVLAVMQPSKLRILDWSISIDDLEYENTLIGTAGTFGEASRGTWLHDGDCTTVVVKRLYKVIDSYADTFLQELEQWHNLKSDKNILQLYGGFGVDSPKFYVCEYAEHGNLRSFLGKENNHSQFWHLFEQTAQGLKVLHDNGLAHGALKCNNILVGANYTAKLVDFGFRSVRALSASLSGDAEEAVRKAVRWKAKELLEENSTEELLYGADIYALGMCMIEALTQQDPFEAFTNDEVTGRVIHGKHHPRPNGISDLEWELISQLSHPDYMQRPQLGKVLKEISVFAEEEKQQRQPAAGLMK